MYNIKSEEKTVRIPVRIVNGSIKYFYGGDLPNIEDGIIGELIIPEYSVLDNRFIEISQLEDKVEILPSGSIIMIAINGREVPEDLKEHLKQLPDVWRNKISTAALYEEFVEVELQDPLYLMIRGSKKSTLRDVKCYISSLDKDASSLNNAYSIISTNFEPHRSSHTGNVFEKCFYKHKDDWYPLEVIRRNQEAKFEEKLFLDYKIFMINEKNTTFNTELNESEKMLLDSIKEKTTLSGKEVKELFNEKEKDDYVAVINDLLGKGILIEVKEQ